jgi:hypothetical protein
MPIVLRPVISFFAAWSALTAVGTALGAQFVLIHLSSMGGAVDFGTWFAVTFGDIFGMLPIIGMFTGGEGMPLGRSLWGTVLGIAFLISMIGAWAAVKWLPPVFNHNQPIVYMVAGFLSIAGIIIFVQSAQGITAIAAARGTIGFIFQCCAGAAAGYVYYFVRNKLDPQ